MIYQVVQVGRKLHIRSLALTQGGNAEKSNHISKATSTTQGVYRFSVTAFKGVAEAALAYAFGAI